MPLSDSGQPAARAPGLPPAQGVERIDPLEEPGWDRALGTVPGATFFHGAAWARVLRDSYGFSPVYHVLGEPARPWAVLPLMEVDSALTGRRGIALPFTDECAPLGAEPDSFGRLFAAAVDHAATRRWQSLEIRGGRATLSGSTASTAFWGHRLALVPEEAAQWVRVESAARRAVRKAEKNALRVEFSRDPAALRAFYRLLCLTRRRHGVPPQPWPFFQNLHQHVLAPGQGWVVLARHGDVPVAGAVFLHLGGMALFKYGASDAVGQGLRANNLVMWEAIKRYGREGFTALDFGRTSLANDGLRRFKLGWGSTERPIEYVKFHLKRREFVRAPDKAGGWQNHIFRHLPLALSRLVGRLLYRHVA